MRRSAIVSVFLLSLACSATLRAQNPTITAVVNAASQGPGLAPGCLANVLGSNLSGSASTGASVGGAPATAISASSTEWTILIPFGLPTGPSTVQIGAASLGITLAQYAPALFSLDQTGTGIVNAQDYTLTSVGALIQPGVPLSAANPANPAKLGDVLVLNATGLGPIDASNYNQTLDTPVVTVGGQPVLVSYAYMTTSPAGTQGDPTACDGAFCYAGMYQVQITLPPAMAPGSQPITLTIGGASSQTLTVPINNLPIIKSIENAASGDATALAPGSLASIYGTTFGLPNLADPASVFPSTSLGGVSVTFNGIPAPLLYLGTTVDNSYGQINVQVPVELPASGPVSVQVTTGSGGAGATSAAATVQMASAAPGVFWFYSAQNPKERNAAIVKAGTSWLVMPSSLAQEYGISGNCVNPQTLCAEPAKAGDSLQIYVTGLGATSPALGTGAYAPASPPYPTALQPTVTVGGVSAPVSFAGVPAGSYAGLYQIDITAPSGTQVGDFVPIAVTMPNGRTDTSTTITIQQ